MKCPGQDSRYWGSEAIYDEPCPACGKLVEFFKDEATRRCTGCGFRFRNPRIDIGCAAWCKFAEACFGTLPDAGEEHGRVSVLDSLVQAVKDVLGEDSDEVREGLRVLARAQELMLEEQAVPKVVLAAALLRRVKNPESARQVLERAEIDEAAIAEVLNVVFGEKVEQHARELAVVSDASGLVRLSEELAESDDPIAETAVEERFSTNTARRRAREMILATLGV
ncbi:MAG: hypothetical protein ABI333_18135 [bacterium]